MPKDVMHVVLEGVLPMEIKNLLNTFMFEDGLFSVEFLMNMCRIVLMVESRQEINHPSHFSLHICNSKATFVW